MLEKFGKEIDLMWYFAFAGTWLVFFLAVNVFRVLLEQISKTRMRFVPPLELVAGPLVGLVAAVMFTSFMAFTLYTMPVRAGEWKLPDSGWQRSTMKTGSGPFYTVLKATLGAEADELFAK